MVKNNFGIKKEKLSLSLVVAVLMLWLSAFPSFAIEYNNSYPFYLPYVGAKYVEVESSTLGRGSLVLSASVPDSYISVGRSSNNLYNNTSSTLSGIFRTRNGTDYSIRFPAFSTPQYYTAGTYNPVYNELVITEIYNTNIKFVDYNNSDKQNDTFIITDNVERLNITLSVVTVILLSACLFVIIFRRSD